MPNIAKSNVMAALSEQFGPLRPLPGSHSLYSVAGDAARIYIRYSKVHQGGRTFYGFRDRDLRQLEGRAGFLCLIVDDGSPPFTIPYADFEDVFRSAEPARDGQHKAQMVSDRAARQLYIARKGRFNIEGYEGTGALARVLSSVGREASSQLSHSQVQTLLAAVGNMKGFDVWVPDTDVGRMDWSLTPRFQLRDHAPVCHPGVSAILSEIDVVWITRGANSIEALYEVEHSTPVYSGLLRLNDLLLAAPSISRFHIVSNETRRDLFCRQLSRPTFRASGLSGLVSFLEYSSVLEWHDRLRG